MRRRFIRPRTAAVAAAVMGTGMLMAGPAMAAQNTTVSGVAPLPAPSYTDQGGTIVCSVAPQIMRVKYWNPQVTTAAGGSERAAGAIELDTFGVGCGDHVKIILQTKVCGAFGCNYQDVASATYSALPRNGAEVFPVISAPLRSGTNRYRLEVDGTKYVWDGDDGPGPGFAGFVPETDSVYTPGVQLTS